MKKWLVLVGELLDLFMGGAAAQEQPILSVLPHRASDTAEAVAELHSPGMPQLAMVSTARPVGDINDIYRMVKPLPLASWGEGRPQDLLLNIKRRVDETRAGDYFLALCRNAETPDDIERFFLTCLSEEDAAACRTTAGQLAHYVTFSGLKRVLSSYRKSEGKGRYPLELVGQRLASALTEEECRGLEGIYGLLRSHGATHEDGVGRNSGKYLAQVIQRALATPELSDREAFVRYAITLIEHGVSTQYQIESTHLPTASIIRLENRELAPDPILRAHLLTALQSQEEWRAAWAGSDDWSDARFQKRVSQFMREGHYKRILLEHGGWNVLDTDDCTPLSRALANKAVSANTISTLLTAGSSPDIMSFQRAKGFPWLYLPLPSAIFARPDGGVGVLRALWFGSKTLRKREVDWHVLWFYLLQGKVKRPATLNFFLEAAQVNVNFYIEGSDPPLDYYASPGHWDLDMVLLLLTNGANWTCCKHPDMVLATVGGFLNKRAQAFVRWV